VVDRAQRVQLTQRLQYVTQVFTRVS
jgi:hypothetical protein